jgi:hypothetical protein
MAETTETAASPARPTPEQLLDDAVQHLPLAAGRDWALAQIRAGVAVPDAINALAIVYGAQIAAVLTVLKSPERGGREFFSRASDHTREALAMYAASRAAAAAAHRAGEPS